MDENGKLIPELAVLAKGDRRMGANPHASGGILLRDLKMPDFKDYAVDVPQSGNVYAEATRTMEKCLRDLMEYNQDKFRVVGPDKTASNRLNALFEVTDRIWMAQTLPYDSVIFTIE